MQAWFVQFGKGFTKIRATCRQALRGKIDSVWIHTYRIDKSSSAELSESINSMFQYYKNSVVCYAFLSNLDPAVEMDAGLQKCRWLTRGWTLQELVAPKELRFYDSG